MPTSIDITFASDPGNGDKVDFAIARVANPTSKAFKLLTFTTTTPQTKEILIPTPTGTPGEASALAYKDAFLLFAFYKKPVVIFHVATCDILFCSGLSGL